MNTSSTGRISAPVLFFVRLRADEPGEHSVYRVDKKRAGRHLDGVEHSGFPQVPA